MQPEVIWADGAGDAPCTHNSIKYWKAPEFLSWLYNESPVKMNTVVNSRWALISLIHYDYWLYVYIQYYRLLCVCKIYSDGVALQLETIQQALTGTCTCTMSVLTYYTCTCTIRQHTPTYTFVMISLISMGYVFQVHPGFLGAIQVGELFHDSAFVLGLRQNCKGHYSSLFYVIS